jgi:hypothetical protein
MPERSGESGAMSRLWVRAHLHRKAKIVAAMAGRSLVDLAQELLEPALAAKERELAHYRSAERPARAPAK